MPALWALALIFLLSGAAKLLTPGSAQAAFDGLKVRRALNTPWIVRSFPFAEIVLAVALVLPLPVLQTIAGGAAVVMMVVFLVLVRGARQTGEACHCFGAASTRPVTTATIGRNVLFLILSVLAVIEAVRHLVLDGAQTPGLATGTWADLAWLVLVALLLAGTALIIGRESAPQPAETDPFPAPAPAAAPQPVFAEGQALAGEVVEEEVPRHPIPSTAVHWNRQYHDLAVLAHGQAMLVFRLSPGCGSCGAVFEHLRGWGEAFGPVALRLAVPVTQLDQTPLGFADVPEHMLLRDPAGSAVAALGLHSYPSAVLLGTDGLTAGGPALGYDAVMELAEEVRAVFAEDAPAPTTPTAKGTPA
nr:hypothetical protein mcr_00097 [Micrococcus sp.]